MHLTPGCCHVCIVGTPAAESDDAVQSVWLRVIELQDGQTAMNLPLRQRTNSVGGCEPPFGCQHFDLSQDAYGTHAVATYLTYISGRV